MGDADATREFDAVAGGTAVTTGAINLGAANTKEKNTLQPMTFARIESCAWSPSADVVVTRFLVGVSSLMRHHEKRKHRIPPPRCNVSR